MLNFLLFLSLSHVIFHRIKLNLPFISKRLHLHCAATSYFTAINQMRLQSEYYILCFIIIILLLWCCCIAVKLFLCKNPNQTPVIIVIFIFFDAFANFSLFMDGFVCFRAKISIGLFSRINFIFGWLSEKFKLFIRSHLC